MTAEGAFWQVCSVQRAYLLESVICERDTEHEGKDCGVKLFVVKEKEWQDYS